MKVTVIPAVDPAVVRAAHGFNSKGTWYQPRRQRPAAFKNLHGRPTTETANSAREAM